MTVEELRRWINLALDELENLHGSEITLPGDFYRDDLGNRYDLQSEYVEGMGSHDDELDFIRSAETGDQSIQQGWVVMLNYLAALLLAARTSALDRREATPET